MVGRTQAERFWHLEVEVVYPLVLLLPNFTKPFTIDADPSNNAIGTGLLQYGNDSNLHPVACISHKYLP